MSNDCLFSTQIEIFVFWTIFLMSLARFCAALRTCIGFKSRDFINVPPAAVHSNAYHVFSTLSGGINHKKSITS